MSTISRFSMPIAAHRSALRAVPPPRPSARSGRRASDLLVSGMLSGVTLLGIGGCGLSAPGRPDASINGGTTRQGIGLAPSGNTPSTDLRVGAGGRTHTAHGHGTGPGTTIGRPAGHTPPGAASGYSGSLGLRRGILGAGPAGSGTGTTIPNRMGASATGRSAGTAFGSQGGGTGGVVTRSTPGASGNGEAPFAAVRPAPTHLGDTGAVGTGFPLAHTPVRSTEMPKAGPVAGPGTSVVPGMALGRPTPAPTAARAPVSSGVSSTGKVSGTGRDSRVEMGADQSPYGDPRARAAHDRTGGAHRLHMGVYRPPVGHRTGTPLSNPGALSALPAWSTLVHYNGYLVSYVRLTPWVANMGMHYGHKGPSLILMQNRSHEVVAAETGFPASKGWEPWYDQPRGRPAHTIYSEHLYFVAPAEITPTMSATLASDLTSYAGFGAVNQAKTRSYADLGPDPSGRATMEGPPGFGIRVLVSKSGPVVGLVAAWPSDDPQGWRPWFDQPQGKPITDPKLGSIYTQHLWLVDPRSLPSVGTGPATPA